MARKTLGRLSWALAKENTLNSAAKNKAMEHEDRILIVPWSTDLSVLRRHTSPLRRSSQSASAAQKLALVRPWSALCRRGATLPGSNRCKRAHLCPQAGGTGPRRYRRRG